MSGKSKIQRKRNEEILLQFIIDNPGVYGNKILLNTKLTKGIIWLALTNLLKKNKIMKLQSYKLNNSGKDTKLKLIRYYAILDEDKLPNIYNSTTIIID